MGRGHLSVLAVVTALLASPVQAHADAPQSGRAYHVAPRGSDHAPGTRAGPLRTIGACLGRVRPGDTCLVHQGTYREQLTPPSGTEGAPITIAAYGDGPVTVDGTERVTGWKDAGGGLIATDTELPPDPDLNAVFVDNARAAEGRWPNSGADPLNATWAEADTTSTDQHIDDTGLPDADWTGATVHLWAGSNPWAQQTGTVTAASAGKLDFRGGNHRCPPLCMGDRTYRNYYLVGSKAALDQPGEWYYDRTAHRLFMVPPKGGIAGHTVTAKHRLWGVDLSDSSHVTVRGLSLWGTSLRTGKSSTGVVVDGLHATYISEFSTLPMPPDGDLAVEPFEGHIVASRILDSGVQILGTGNTLRNSEIARSAGDGVLVRGTGNTVTGNYIHDVGWMGSYTPGIEINGNGHTVTHNTIRRTGRASIDTAWQLNGTEFHGNRIAYNDLSEAMRTSRDGSPFYVCCSLNGSGTSVDHNTAHDADGQNGYYVDNYSGHFRLHHNVAWNTGSRGVFFNGHTGPSIANEDHNSSYGVGVDVASVALGGATDASGSYLSNIVGPKPVTATQTGNPPPVVRSNLIGEKPGYSDAVNGELWLTPGSPAVDAGEVVDGVTTDTVGTAPDQGAYEYGAPVWSTGCDLPGCRQRVRHGDWTATASDGTNARAGVDGDINTRWTGAAAQTVGQSLTVDLGASKTFGRLSLDAGRDTSGQPYGFAVSVSRDGTRWGEPLARVSGRSFTQDAVFPRQTDARYVRVTLTANGPTPWVVNDIRLYGDGPDAASTLQAEQATSVRGVAHGPAATGILGSGDALGFDAVNVRGGHLTVRLASTCARGCSLGLRLDSPHGPVAAVVPLTDTGGEWRERSVALRREVTGTHDLYLVAKGGVRVAALDWLTIRP
ncbi:discoidin domain-containing protein [Streptomyces sp. WI04-05B]|uniref:discoidin domain-containing protein n=1 Tax=Streptomyces TaxID=1883 RepID=UPI0029A460FD|nr:MULTISPECIES: discoidin domain-containing protein [unclassified Streptomyces]MDX2548607.1 discoidin domain-containing protein [Streptomyces sp. WI04-05B]MDX2589070.1 discoidin domain-containing protein [Streptomyces sp. WI04-05A]